MTVPTRGVRSRRGGRRPGWMLLTALLVLVIAASSALVFTNRVELLKLAVILALWAAVVAAFVSVIYRRQSDMDQAKVRDLKLVYDLQLDRETSARREYELTVESHLRHELASELRAQAADEVAALRAELAALRANLEILFDTDLGHRPAIETERTTVRAYSDWARDSETTGRVTSTRIDTESHEEDTEGHEEDARTEESPIIDVPAEPHPPEHEWAASAGDGGAHRRPSEAEPEGRRHLTEEPEGRRHLTEEPQGRRHVADEPQPASSPPQPPEPPPQEPERVAEPTAATEWHPAPAEGQWIPAGTPGSNWVSPVGENGSSAEHAGARQTAPEPAMSAPHAEPRLGRHSGEESGGEADEAAVQRARHSALPEALETGRPTPPPTLAKPPAQPPPPPPSRHRSADESEDEGGQHTGGQSVAELLARLQAAPTEGGRRRRREE